MWFVCILAGSYHRCTLESQRSRLCHIQRSTEPQNCCPFAKHHHFQQFATFINPIQQTLEGREIKLTSARGMVGMHLALVFNKFLKNREKKTNEETQTNKWTKLAIWVMLICQVSTLEILMQLSPVLSLECSTERRIVLGRKAEARLF